MARRRLGLSLTLLLSAGVIAKSDVGQEAASEPPRVGLYMDAGNAGSSAEAWARLLEGLDDMTWRPLSAGDIAAGELGAVSVLIMPGGVAYEQAAALGPAGRETIRSHVAEGGGYVGTCAGAYLALGGARWKLCLLDGTESTPGGWRQGEAEVQLRLTALGRGLLRMPPGTITGLYLNGPQMTPCHHPGLADMQVLATYAEAGPRGGDTRRRLGGHPAIVVATWGHGRVLALGPHIEGTPGHADTAVQMVRLARPDSVSERQSTRPGS